MFLEPVCFSSPLLISLRKRSLSILMIIGEGAATVATFSSNDIKSVGLRRVEKLPFDTCGFIPSNTLFHNWVKSFSILLAQIRGEGYQFSNVDNSLSRGNC